jgi:superfamily II DNA or RNA helicase
MSEIRLSEKLLAGLAGWEVVKQARSIVAEDRVLSSSWEPPMLRGVVQSGSTSYRSGLVIRRENDAENLCTCRPSREWGTICPHSVAVGIHALKPVAGSAPAPASGPERPGKTPARTAPLSLRRLTRADGGTGVPLELQVILPPNLAEGLARGKATVFFEGRWSRGRVPLAGLPLDQPFALAEEDARLLDHLELAAGGDSPAMVQVGSSEFVSLLEVLVEHPRVTLGRNQPVTIRREPWRAPLCATLQPGGEIVLESRPLARKPVLIAGEPPWVMDGVEFRTLGLPKDCRPVLGGPLRWPRSRVPEFVSSILPQLEGSADLEANFTAADFELAPRPPGFLLHLAGGLATLSAQLQCVYQGQIMTVGMTPATETLWLPDPANPRRYSTRDLAAERGALDRLRRHGFTGPDAHGRYHLHGQNQVLTFFAREFSRLEQEWKVTLEERLQRSTRNQLERIEPRLSVTPSGEQWFDLEVTFASDQGERLSATEVQRLLRGGQTHTRLKNGKFALIDTGAVEELEEILVDCAPEQHAGRFRIGHAQAGFLGQTFKEQGWETSAPPSWHERVQCQTGQVSLECPPLGPLENVLRPYQKAGVAWLGFLRRNLFGGILADEMGLGKTLQTLAHLATLRGATGPGEHRPHLVICPTSLVTNWVAEARRFTPGLRVLALHGPDRQALFERLRDAELVITSYALMRRDLERYRHHPFDTVILDEAQHIKNRQTQNAQTVKAIRARHRLVLTGTPLENSVLDLWSIFDFLMPGYLGNATDFRDRYEVPIVREKDPAAQARLGRRIRPFLLRRLKHEVAPELPPRIDQVLWCELSDEQASVYQQLLAATRHEVFSAVGAHGMSRNRMLVLTALLRLRQVCCDLRLLETAAPGDNAGDDGAGAKDPPGGAASGKIDAFSELLEEVIDGGHRVLVFSQFTRMLGLLRERLDAEKVRYCYLDGSTRDRAGEVARFQNAADIPVFLISLKAGGLGLNLTGADTVVHFDPWWNPAVEEQASDRAHRIGQERVVTSYKLITRGTVEEKILALQRREREIIGNVLTGEEPFAESLTWEEIRELLE